MQIAKITRRDHRDRRVRSRSKTRVFVHLKGESIRNDIVNRRTRPAKLWKPFAVRAAEAMGLKFESLSWSQKAGCKCGCSPGFIVKGDHRSGFDVHVTLKA